jgi:2-isopropylmalate synthase
MERVVIFDTTLRDGEQAPGFSMNLEQKIRMARQLAALNVDVLEAGFPIASPGDFEAVKAVAAGIRGPVIAGLARANGADIEACADALAAAPRRRIHTFIATSDLHIERKLRSTRERVFEAAVEAVRRARHHTDDIEFSAEDAARTDRAFLCRIVEAVIDAGATTVNIPDTVGYSIPSEFGDLIAHLKRNVPNVDRATISVHCHNDLGLAVANSLAGVQNGARQIECTINGIGERAGNASLEEVVMALSTRKDVFGGATRINAPELFPSSRLLCALTGIEVQPNKAIVGANAFAHEAGIHQDGMLKDRATYEILTPASVGWVGTSLVMGKHSGRHALRERLKALGYDFDGEVLNAAFARFKALADKRKEIGDEDLRRLAEDILAVMEVARRV